jgi:hypothetical protein
MPETFSELDHLLIMIENLYLLLSPTYRQLIRSQPPGAYITCYYIV